jgi:hypothetical protein
MGLPLITYNGRTINFTQQGWRYQLNTPRQIIRNQSAAGLVETLKIRADVEIELDFRWFVNTVAADAELKRQLKQWHVWAQEGRPWNIGMNSDDTVYTTLTANAPAGSTAITLDNMILIVVGGLYIVRNELNLELVKVTAIGGSTVTIAEPLNFGYLTGDRFRSERVWPARLLRNDNVIIEKPPRWYDVELRFAEDVNAL